MLQSSDKRVLTAATEIVRKGLATVTLLGDPEAVAQDADRLGLHLSGIQVIDHMVRSSVLLLAAKSSRIVRLPMLCLMLKTMSAPCMGRRRQFSVSRRHTWQLLQ